jgi:hypothetical protein
MDSKTSRQILQFGTETTAQRPQNQILPRVLLELDQQPKDRGRFLGSTEVPELKIRWETGREKNEAGRWINPTSQI